jgi:uncharacterized protein DUF29
MTDTLLYETDIVAWADRQVAELRRLAESRVTNTVDWANVIDEIESVGRSELTEVQSLIENALTHLIKALCDHNSLSKVAWRAETDGFLRQARRRFRPSMRQHLDVDVMWDEAFRAALDAIRPYRISIPPGIPTTSPFNLDELLDETMTFDLALPRLHSVVESWTRNGDNL